jgi:molecular chaperone GrpE
MSTEQEDTRLSRDERISSDSAEERRDASPQDDADDSGTVALPEDYLEVKSRAEERDRFLDELKRSRADLENLQKRTRRERPELERTGARRVLTDLLGVVDNFERALASLGSEGVGGAGGATSGLEEGVRMIHHQLQEVLRNQGVKEIAALGESFNPEYHEAVKQEELEDRPTGYVVEVLQWGYMHHDAVLRPTAVKVARNVADREASPEEDHSQDDEADGRRSDDA